MRKSNATEVLQKSALVANCYEKLRDSTKTTTELSLDDVVTLRSSLPSPHTSVRYGYRRTALRTACSPSTNTNTGYPHVGRDSTHASYVTLDLRAPYASLVLVSHMCNPF